MKSLETPLIPRKLLFGNPVRASAQISPDGKTLSWLAPDEGLLNIWIAPVDTPENARVITQDRVRGIRMYMWSYCARYVLYVQDTAGDENWHLHAVDPQTGEDRNLTDIEGATARMMSRSWDRPDEMIIGLNDRDASWHDVYHLDLVSGERSLVYQNEMELGSFVFDRKMNMKLAEKSLDIEGISIVYKRVGDEWEEFFRLDHEDQLTTSLLGFDKSGDYFFMVDSRGRDTGALMKVSYETGDAELLAENDKADLDDIMLHPTEYTLQAWATNYLKKEWTVVDPSIAADMAVLEEKFGKTFEVQSRTREDDVWIMGVQDAKNPGAAWLYKRQEQSLTKLYSVRPDLENQPLAEMETFTIRSRDGLDLPAYMTRATWGKPGETSPLVLIVHGGPWARDMYSYNAFQQWMANRGYSVLSINFRGSTGYGKSFINAADGEWGRKMHDDLLDAVEWAISEGITERDKVAIFGGSYGGYAALAGLAFTPDVFACGIDIVGPSNLETLLETIPPYWKAFYEQLARRVGDPRTEEGLALLKERSPLNSAGNISKPLLIGQGANDPRVKQAESDQIVEAMKAKGLPVIYVLYPDEGHGWARPENQFSFNAVTEQFLANHLGGRSEPIGDAFEGSSIEILEGKESIDGLVN